MENLASVMNPHSDSQTLMRLNKVLPEHCKPVRSMVLNLD